MTTALEAISANDLLERRAAPMLKVYDDVAFHGDALSGLAADDIGALGKDLAITASRQCAAAANAMRAAIDSLREHVACLYQLPDAGWLMTTDTLIKVGRRDAGVAL